MESEHTHTHTQLPFSYVAPHQLLQSCTPTIRSTRPHWFWLCLLLLGSSSDASVASTCSVLVRFANTSAAGSASACYSNRSLMCNFLFCPSESVCSGVL